nr:MAG: ABC transporter permease [Chloroflexota bacterium]
MIADIGTIVWKELKELITQKPNLRGGWVGLLVFLGVFGVLMPVQMGEAWVEQPTVLVYWLWVPFLMVSTVVADSFAGERERHTLETLLASRLSDRAILFGKLASAVIYGWGLTMVSVILGVITVNVVNGQGRLLFFPPEIAVAIFVLTLLVALLSAGIGVLISLRAPTVRQAQQTMGIVGLAPLIPLLLIPIVPQETQIQIANTLMQMDLFMIVMGIFVLLLVVDIVLILLAMARFQRAKLILD